MDPAIRNSVCSIEVAQKQLSIASQNIAHANDDTYSRLRVNLDSDMFGNVKIKSIKAVVDQYLEREMRHSATDSEYYSTYAKYLHDMSNVFNQPSLDHDSDKVSNLSDELSDFFIEIGKLDANTNFNTLKAAIVSKAKNIGVSFNQISQKFERVKLFADKGIQSAVDDVNHLVDEIGYLNENIQAHPWQDEAHATMQSNMDSALQELSKYVDCTVHVQDSGATYITIANGITLLDSNTIAHFAYEKDAIDDDFGKVKLVSSEYSSDAESLLSSGQIRALLDIRDVEANRVLEQVDKLAYNFVSEFNDVYSRGVSYPGKGSVIGDKYIVYRDNLYMHGAVNLVLLNKDGDEVSHSAIDLNGLETVQDLVDKINVEPGLGAQLVDEDGNAIIARNVPGFLNIYAKYGDNTIAIDNASSGSDSGNFVQVMSMDNFFNQLVEKEHSGLNVRVRDEFVENSGDFNTGILMKNDDGKYFINAGNIDVVRKLSSLSDKNINDLDNNFINYSIDVAASVHENAHGAEVIDQHMKVYRSALRDEYSQISGVNIDEELVKATSIYQTYNASAHIISVVKALYDMLFNSLG